MRIGPYEVGGELGRGGMGVVYRARSSQGEDVAIKVLTETGDPDARASFDREKRLLWSLGEAEGFVAVRDAGEDSGRPYLVMPLVPGGTLRARLQRGPLPVDEALALARELAKAIGKAHERGIVHRDLKPENVLFTKQGRPLVADLGLAKHFRKDVLGASQSRALSATGVIAGTPGYMAPEQIEDSKRVGPAADVFALGVMLYESLAGERPFAGNGLLGFTEALRSGPATPLRKIRPEVAPWLEAVVARALARDLRERFADALTFQRALVAQPTAGRGRYVLASVVVIGALLPAVVLVVRSSNVATSKQPLMPAPPRASPPTSAEPSAKGPSDADRTRAKELVESGNANFSKGDVNGAIADYTRAIELAPKLAEAWMGRGYAKINMKDFDGAILDLERFLELAPDHQQAPDVRTKLERLSATKR